MTEDNLKSHAVISTESGAVFAVCFSKRLAYDFATRFYLAGRYLVVLATEEHYKQLKG